jgi:hypothetical protein
MRWMLAAGFALGWAGCAPKPPPAAPSAPAPLFSEFTCPPGTELAGAAPPVGVEVWCSRPMPDGTKVRSGPSLSWHGNGQKQSQGAYLQDKREGPWLYWYPTGTPERQGSYSNGKPDGVWTSYHPTGDRSSEGQMVDGKENGRWTFWNNESMTRTEGEFLLGERDGVWMDFGPEDQPVRERSYRTGRLVSQRDL